MSCAGSALLDRRAIGLDVRLDLGMRVPGDAEHADARRAGALERLEIGRRIPQGRVRALDRPRHHLTGRQIEMGALVAGEMLQLEHLHHGLERLAPDLARVVRVGAEAEPLHHVRRRSAARAELAAAIAEHVERGDTLGDHERVVTRHQDHREAQPDPARALRQRREKHLGAGRMADLGEEMLLGEPEVREAGILRRGHLVEVLRVDVRSVSSAQGFGTCSWLINPNFISSRPSRSFAKAAFRVSILTPGGLPTPPALLEHHGSRSSWPWQCQGRTALTVSGRPPPSSMVKLVRRFAREGLLVHAVGPLGMLS